MPSDAPRTPPSAAGGPPLSSRRATALGVFAAVALAGLTAVTVLWPAAAVTVQTARALADDPAQGWTLASRTISLQTLISTALYTLGIGTLATLLALPAAWVLARPGTSSSRFGPTAWTALVLSPLLLPSYLAYAGWGTIRGPNTYLGDWLAVRDPWLSILAGRVMAVAGMTLWVWPLSAMVMAGAVRSLRPEIAELTRLDAPSRWARVGVVARVLRAGWTSAILLVALVMTGSAIPLHVAQVPTYAIELWKAMQLSPGPAGVWVAALPLVMLAAGASWALTRSLAGRMNAPELVLAAAPAPRATRLATLAVWAVSVLAPLALFAWSLKSWRSVPMFWRISGPGAIQSLELAAWTAGLAAAVLLLTWLAIDLGGRGGRIAALWTAGLLLFSGLIPGVLVGVAVNTAAGQWPSSGGSWIVILTHLTRFGFVGALGGWWLASLQPRDERWMRELDAGGSAWAWLVTTVRPQWASVLGLALAVAALSFHEIESTVMVLPPGLANLPQQLLDYLHYARDEQLSAAAINLLSLGVVFALAAAALAARARRTITPSPTTDS